MIAPVTKALLLALMLLAVSCGPTLPAGSTSRTISFAGARYSYILHTPKIISSNPALLLVLHGLKGDGAGLQRRTRGVFEQLANRDGFIVAYPDAQHDAWNSGHRYAKSDADDVNFLSALIDALSAEFHVDPEPHIRHRLLERRVDDLSTRL